MAYTVLLGVPSSGVISESAALASYHASYRHKVHRLPSALSGPNYNSVWCAALNYGMAKKVTHFAMMHTDIEVIEDEAGLRWIDRLIEEMDKVGADFISTPIAIKDHFGLTSCGIGNPENEWNPWRRFCVNELDNMPMTFNADMVGYGDKFLIHNHALCVWDMRKPLWYETKDTRCKAIFNLSEDIRLEQREEGLQWCRYFHSEDWAYSRNLWEMGAKTWITRRIKVEHQGAISYRNWGGEDLLLQNGDESTSSQWRIPGAPNYLSPVRAARAEAVKVQDEREEMLTHDQLTERMKAVDAKQKALAERRELLEHQIKEIDAAADRAQIELEVAVDMIRESAMSSDV